MSWYIYKRESNKGLVKTGFLLHRARPRQLKVKVIVEVKVKVNVLAIINEENVP